MMTNNNTIINDKQEACQSHVNGMSLSGTYNTWNVTLTARQDWYVVQPWCCKQAAQVGM